MIKWKDACETVSYNPSEQCPYSDTFTWFAYKEGTAISCVDEKSARALSQNVEKVLQKNPVRQKWFEASRYKEMKASEIFHNALREEYSHLNEKVYNIVYAMAYGAGHSAGYDEVANYMITYSTFAEDIIKASR